MAPLSVPEGSIQCPLALVAARRGGSDPDRYVAPTEAERAALRDAIALLMKEGPSARDRAAQIARGVGFSVVDLPEVAGAVLVQEVETWKRGGGAYVVRMGARSPEIVIEAPHTFSDEGTFPLAYDLFVRTKAFALFINTSHRYKSSPPDEHGDHPSDVAHNPSSLFQAATEGALHAVPHATVVQLHGFAARGNETSIVLSAGEKREGDDLVSRAATALATVLPGVKKYPEDSGELGATTNVQGQIVRQNGGRFLHVELETRLRRELGRDAARRAAIFDALARVLEESAR